jgi:hypothetical protein
VLVLHTGAFVHREVQQTNRLTPGMPLEKMHGACNIFAGSLVHAVE